MEISEYLKEIQKTYTTNQATEHSYRLALAKYLTALFGKDISVINEPKRKDYGATDFIISQTSTEIPIGYIETKDLNTDLKKIETNEQLTRYRESLSNLILTDYLEFIYYKAGEEHARVRIAELKKNRIISLKENFDEFKTFLENFCKFKGQFIGTPQELASVMAKKTNLMKIAFQTALTQQHSNKIKEHFGVFKEHLITDLTEERFASIYAETLAYGLFIARIHNGTEFRRIESHELIPAIFPFLKELFTDIATRLDENIKWVIDELCELLRNSEIENILKNLGSLKKKHLKNNNGKTDPVIYFYEDFLKKYNPQIRKARGIYYTPEPVVNFIVRAIDTVLKNNFNLSDGIADKSKTTISINGGKKEVHKVQLLDVATGTGSFIAEVIKQIYKTFQGQAGLWSSYVEKHLLPRLHGFEILMGGYAMCHLKINLLLKETGYISENKETPQRLGVYLTNALEQPKEDVLPVANLLAKEAEEANQIKKETPVMVAFGNPPYSISSQNKGKWIQDLIQVYKENLKERKINIDDDYIKFIRLAEHYIGKNEKGIVAMITNNSFVDGVTHRQMRKHLLETFDCIYIYNLHGDSRKKETAPDGSKDENVFDIMQGVAISIFIKDDKRQGKLADVFYLDSYGKREDKYQKLWELKLNKKNFQKLKYKEPYYFFVPKDFAAEEEYNKGFKIKKFFLNSSVGIKTKVDKIAIDFDKNKIIERIEYIINNQLTIEEINNKYGGIDIYKTTWEYIPKSIASFDDKSIIKYEYRPFDYRFIFFHNKFLSRARNKIMDNFYNKENVGLELSRNGDFVFIGKFVSDEHFASDNSFKFPLYLYNGNNSIDKEKRKANLNQEIVREIEKKLGLKFVADHELSEAQKSGNFSPLDLLDYIYAVLHSPSYREKYQEFLKIDFPRVPYPEDKEKFKKLVKLGSQLRETHLLQGKNFGGRQNFITNYDIQGNNLVEKIYFDLDENSSELGRVYINKTQYFGKVPKVAWDFFIGGYQPAQKWLKDRKDRLLSSDDIEQYQKIILALKTTSDIMPQIDPILFS